MRRPWILLLCLPWLLVPAHSLVLSPVEGANEPPLQWVEWVDFVGQGGSTLDDQPLSAGAVVRAYDPTGVLAGEFVVPGGDYPPGWYGLMPVYRDRPDTPEDDGAEPGDHIAFTVNGYPAVPLGPDPPVWTQHGSLVQVNLRACTLAGDFDCDCRVTVADLMRQARGFGAVRGQARQ
ncbi:MAG: hypothetical protein ACE5LU_29475 [Anaerolineae bacterium]